MPLLPADFTQPSLQTILRINLDGTGGEGANINIIFEFTERFFIDLIDAKPFISPRKCL